MTYSTNELLELLPLHSGVSVLSSHPDGLIALDKPPGLMSHPNDSKGSQRTLLKAAYNFSEERYEWSDGSGQQRFAWLINRLDSPTSGVVLLGLDAEISAAAKAQFAAHAVTKIYYALVRGKPVQNLANWSDRLKKEMYGGTRGESGAGGASSAPLLSAQTQTELVRSSTGPISLSLLKLTPLTGRTHQLRIQCQKRGLPIVGDRTYGDFSFNRRIQAETGVKRMMLHSGQTQLKWMLRGQAQDFYAESVLPKEFTQLLGEYVNDTAKLTRNEILKGRRFRT